MEKTAIPIPDNLTGPIHIGFAWDISASSNKMKGFYIDDISLAYLSGITENINGSLWSLFPNPASNQLTISLPDKVNKVDIIITDITGKTVYQTTISASEKLEVNISTFAEGVYLVRVQTKDFVETKKVIITK